MIDGKGVLALIPARGGSKGLAGKNIAPCGGKPLIQWTIEAAKASKYVNAIHVTSDSSDVISAALSLHVGTIARPAHLAEDDTPMFPVIMHALQLLPDIYHICVLLQPTSPLRTAADIDGALELLVSSGAKTVTSVYESHAVPFTGVEPVRRQDRAPMLLQNGAVYAFDIARFRETLALIDKDTVPFVMPHERSIDVDVPLDMALASLLIGK